MYKIKLYLSVLTIAVLFASCSTSNKDKEPTLSQKEINAQVEEALKKSNDEGRNKIISMLKDKDDYVRWRTVVALVEFGAKEYAKDIAERLKDEDDYGMHGAVWALVKLDAKEHAKDIAEQLKYYSGVLGVRPLGGHSYTSTLGYELMEALVKFGAREYAKDIAEFLNDDDPAIRASAVWALGELDAREYDKSIGKLLKDDDEDVRELAAVVLEKWTSNPPKK